jgi:hypothetical protein
MLLLHMYSIAQWYIWHENSFPLVVWVRIPGKELIILLFWTETAHYMAGSLCCALPCILYRDSSPKDLYKMTLKAIDHLICNHFSRKVVLKQWFCKLGFFFSGQPLFSNKKKKSEFAEPLFSNLKIGGFIV